VNLGTRESSSIEHRSRPSLFEKRSTNRSSCFRISSSVHHVEKEEISTHSDMIYSIFLFIKFLAAHNTYLTNILQSSLIIPASSRLCFASALVCIVRRIVKYRLFPTLLCSNLLLLPCVIGPTVSLVCAF
jgi:hypothetical protein